LSHLHEGRRLRRWQPDKCSPCVYFTSDRRPAQAEHFRDTNWAYVWLTQRMTSSDQWVIWEKPDYGYLQPDALGVMYCRLPNEHRAWFVELDRSDNRWDKCAKYSRLHDEREGQWWHKYVDFPTILVVTFSQERANRISEIIAVESMGVNYRLMQLDDVRKEALRWLKG
jgi:hypothetical protein